MADAQLKVTMASQDIRVGDGDNSRLSIDIRNDGSAKATFTFYITIPTAFVAAEAADSIAFAGLTATKDDDCQPQDGTRWRIGTRKGTPIDSGSAITLTLSNIAAASAGQPKIDIEWRRGPDVAGSASLPVTVLATNDAPKIISFAAESYVIWKQSAKSPVKLAWETDRDSVVELWRLGTKLLPAPAQESAPRTMPQWEWNDRDYDSSGIQPYQLKATAGGKTVSRWLFVRIQDPGWNRIECRQGAPTLLVNDGDNTLYGVFVRDGEAAVYQLEPEKGALGRADVFCCKVPEGMEQSPGAFFQNKIWLVGGSQIDPEVCSDKVWCFDPKAKQSGPVATTGTPTMWTPRMGHVCTTFDGKLWILGGVDENGNTLSDVWYLEGTTWRESKPLKTPLCLLAATEFDNTQKVAGDHRLWVYGGLDAPFGTPQTALWSLAKDGSDWQRMTRRRRTVETSGQDLYSGDPFGSALCVDKTQGVPLLCGLGTFQESQGIISAMFRLTGLSYGATNEADLTEVKYPITPDNGWPTLRDAAALQQPFRLSAVAFRSHIFVVSLVYGADNRSLTYLVQSVLMLKGIPA